MIRRSVRLFFRCKKCGDVPVDKDTFKRFVTDWGGFKLTIKLNASVIGAAIVFEDDCPKCSLKEDGHTSGKSNVKVVLIKEVRHEAGISEN